jgi:hypothetical protein
MNIQNAKKVITAAAAVNDTVIMESVHGIGKSSIVEEFARENNFYCMPLFLSHQEVGDLIGIPRTITKGTEVVTTWTKPIWLARMVDCAWPAKVANQSDIEFADPELEKQIKAICEDITDREQLNDAYTKVKELTPGTMHLTSKQMDITNKQSKRSVLFLDELNRAPIDVRQSSLQLVLEKKVHEHELPYVQGKATVIVAAINPADKYQVDTLDTALLDRFLHIDVEADLPAWLDWARASNINQIVRDFLTEKPNRLWFQPADESKKGATPRSWAKLASFVDIMDTIPPEIQHPIMKGKIGSELASEFLSYYNSYSKALKLEDVEKHIAKTKKKYPDDITKVGAAVNKFIKSQEVIQKSEMAKQFLSKYLNKSQDEAYPMLAYLYGLDLEIRASILKGLKADNIEDYRKLAQLDAVNNKELFMSIRNVTTKEQA